MLGGGRYEISLNCLLNFYISLKLKKKKKKRPPVASGAHLAEAEEALPLTKMACTGTARGLAPRKDGGDRWAEPEARSSRTTGPR